MIWVRRVVVFILSLVLLICLIGEAFSFSTVHDLYHANKLEVWLSQSNVYSSVVDNELHDAQQNATNDTGAGRVSLSDPQVEQAVKSVFSTSVVQGYADTFIKSNYAWLQGKTAKPDFKIDLTSNKQQLANQLAQAVKTRVSGLSACSAAQLSQLQTSLNTDPLTLPCALPSLPADTASQQVQKQIAESSDFLNNPVITASSLNPNDGNQGQPYYQRLSQLPKAYRLNQKAPWIFGIVGLFSILGIIFISITRRRGWRRLGWVFGIAGLLLVIYKFVADSLFNRLEQNLFNHSNLDQFQKSVTSFLHLVETQLVKIDFWFGVGYLVVALLILITLKLRRDRGRVKPAVPPPAPPAGTTSTGAPRTGEKPPVPPLKRPASPPPPKRPRLIQ